MKRGFKVNYAIKVAGKDEYYDDFVLCVGDSEASAAACLVYDMINRGVEPSLIRIGLIEPCKLLHCANYGFESDS